MGDDLARRVVLGALFLIWAPEALSKQPVMRLLDWRSGLPGVSHVVTVEQDPEGFLWIGSTAGVLRYDGAEMRTIAGRDFGLVQGSAAAGSPLVQRLLDQRWELRWADGAPVAGPDGTPFRPRLVCMTLDRALWSLDDEGVRRRAADGTWFGPYDVPPGSELRGVQSGRDGSVLALGEEAVFRIEVTGRAAKVADARGAIHALDRANGSTAIGSFLANGSRVYEARDGAAQEIDRGPTRFMALAERDGVLWAAYDNRLVRIAPGEPREEITLADGLPSGGEMLVDREGSLWVATFRGLAQFPEPEASSWQREAPVTGRNVVAGAADIWMSSWSGLFRARLESAGWTLTQAPAAGDPVCATRSGAVLARGALFASGAPGPPRPIRLNSSPQVIDCSTSPGGRVWSSTLDGLYVADPGDAVPRLVAPTRTEADQMRTIHEDRRGRLWVVRNSAVCWAPAEGVRSRAAVVWTCFEAPGSSFIRLLDMDSGAIWATSMGQGVWRLREDRFEPIPAAAGLASSLSSGLSRSPSGGVWIAGEGVFLRVRERTDLPEGWEELERVGLWQGLPTTGISDILETGDGTLWAATHAGLVRIPPRARQARPEPPSVALVEASVDGRSLDLAPERTIELPFRRNRLELRFAALSYREPTLIRYRTRLDSRESWSVPTTRPFFRFVDLAPGEYRVEVEATLDGERWSRATQAVAFVVLRPWHRTWWFFALAGASIGGMLALAYRLRVATLLGLERQRVRIAMDLHDEVGSGLGTIGVLTGILGRTGLAEAQREELAGRAAAVAGELSQSLGDIVWSLRAGSDRLDALWARVLDRGQPLLAAGTPRLVIDAPDPVPRLRLSPAVCRNVSLMTIEALHNAARHAAASTVVLGLARDGAGWCIRIEDDGVGFAEDLAGDATRRGLGLEGMKARAADMGGSVSWERPETGGTRVWIRFG